MREAEEYQREINGAIGENQAMNIAAQYDIEVVQLAAGDGNQAGLTTAKPDALFTGLGSTLMNMVSRCSLAARNAPKSSMKLAFRGAWHLN